MEAATIDLIDIGVNLVHDSFDTDREALLRRAAEAGVRRCIVTGTTTEASRAAVELARQHHGTLFATAGVHPHHAEELDAQVIVELGRLAAHPGLCAIGECGLDYFRNYSPAAAQREAFIAQLELAVATGKPVFLHQRDAHADFLEILAPYAAQLAGGVAHCFTGDAQQMQAYLELGLHIGITGWICDERRGASLQAAVEQLPLDRVLLETDAPYLLPRDLPEKPRGRRNSPEFLPHILKAAARHMGCDAKALAAASTANAERLFRLPETNFATTG